MTPAEIAASVLLRIDEREPSLHAWQFFDPDMVMAAATSEREPDQLTGSPIGVKDASNQRQANYSWFAD